MNTLDLEAAGMILAIFFRTSDADLEILEQGLSEESRGLQPSAPGAYQEALDRLRIAGQIEASALAQEVGEVR